jgi:hypothetical protein
MQDIDEEYLETYFEITMRITHSLADYGQPDFVTKRYDNQGRGGVWELAKELTDEFQEIHKDKEWDGEFFDELDLFWEKKLQLPN